MIDKKAKKEIAISVKNLHKEFVLPQNKNSTLKQGFVNIVKKNNKLTQKVLDGISFEIEKGDFFGIVGRNGSGKSTLLKILAGVYTPTKGTVDINGGLTPFIELGVGFNPELSGRDNVYLNGALLGFTRTEMSEMYDDIVEFSELEPFMDQKLKNYSSGMQVRLAFSIAIKAENDILVLDEVLAVGDEAFQRKCNDYFDKISKDEDQTVILVTHSMGAVKKYCNKAILIKDGKIVLAGSPEDIANEYSMENLAGGAKKIDKSIAEGPIRNFKVTMRTGPTLNQNEEASIDISYDADQSNTYVVADVKDLDRGTILVIDGGEKFKTKHVRVNWKMKFGQLNNTNMIINLVVRDEKGDILYYLPEEDSPKFFLRRTDYPDPKNPTSHATLFKRGLYNK